jgi:hypothetical protein
MPFIFFSGNLKKNNFLNTQKKENWLLQINYPEISVKLDNSGASMTRVNFRQARYLLNEEEIPGIDTVSPFGYKWLIYCKLTLKFFKVIKMCSIAKKYLKKKVQCKAGGTYNPTNGLNQHITGSTDEYNFYLTGEDGKSFNFLPLNRRFCNRQA